MLRRLFPSPLHGSVQHRSARWVHGTSGKSSPRLSSEMRQISLGIKFPKYGALVAGAAIYGALAAGIYIGYKRSKERSRLKALCTPLQPNSFVRAKLDLCEYKGTVVTTESVKSGHLERVESLDVRDSDLFVASFPKSGTTWVQEMVLQLMSKDEENVSLETSFPYLEFVYPGLKSIEEMREPRLLKTHLPVHLLPSKVIEMGAKVIYIHRNPKDVAVSYFHFARWLAFIHYVGEFDDFANDFLNNRLPYGPFFSHLSGYLELSRVHPDQVLVLCYEDLQRDLPCNIRKVASFLGLENVNEDEVAKKCSFEAMKKNPRTNYEHWNDLGLVLKGRSEFMRKGKVGDFRNHFKNQKLEIQFDEWIKQGEIDINQALTCVKGPSESTLNEHSSENKNDQLKECSFNFKFDK